MSFSFAQNSFLAGEWSQAMQGRWDRPDYRTAMNVCLNSIPVDTGACNRRPGSQFAGTTRSGAAGRVITFSFKQSTPYTIEFTDSHMRFWNGTSLVTGNDDVAVTSISTATPALLTVTPAVTWATNDQVFFNNLTVATPLLMERMFTLTKLSTTTFTLTDAITGASIDGSTLGTLAGGVTVSRARDIVTPFAADGLASIRSVQAEMQAMLLSGQKPYVLTATAPTDSAFATFALAAANFLDGPYLDPFANGVLATPSAKTGVVTITLSFNAYSATKAYSVGDYVTSSSVTYISIADTNVGNTPVSSPTFWTATSAGAAVGPNGFVGSDIGRHIRLYSEPPLWVVGGSYTAGSPVAYVDTTGATAYYTSLTTNTGALTNQPGASLTNWAINAAGAIWTWGKITSLSNLIAAGLAGSASIGNMTSGGGLAAAFDGIISQSAAAGAEKNTTGNDPTTAFSYTAVHAISAYVGKNYSGASDQVIQQGTVFPSSDFGLIALLNGTLSNPTINLRGKASVPASASDGTLLGTTGVLSAPYTSPQTIVSTDQVTAWKYVWFELTGSLSVFVPGSGFPGPGVNWGWTLCVAEAQFFNPTGTGSSTGVNVQIVGSDLLYTTPIRTWRLGLFTATTGFPMNGTYHEGRVWFGGSIDNRFDGSVPISHPNGLTTINFAPTQSDGTVTDANAISYTLDGPDVNPIFWMVPDQQGIIVGTQAGEWLVQATNINSPLTPTSIQAHRVTTIGCANIEPRRTEHTLVFVQRLKHKLMEYFADVYSGKFSAPNLSLTAKHLATRGLEEIAYQQELSPVIWARCADGSLIGCSYKRESLASSQGPTFAGWHRHTLGSARDVESICTGPSTDGLLDTLAMVTNDTSNIRHVEFLTNLFEEGSDISTAWHLDDAVTPFATQNTTVAGVPVFQLLGLWHLVGQTISVFAGGLDVGDYVVQSNGTVNVPFGVADGLFTTAFVAAFTDGIPVVAGFTYNSDGQMVRAVAPQEAGTRSGPALGKLRRTQQFVALLNSTQGFSYGTDFGALVTANFRTPGGTAYAANVPFSGVYRNSIKDNDSYDSMICWRISRPYPAIVCAIEGLLDTKDA